MTTALEEFLAHINRRISILEAELERLQQVKTGIADHRGSTTAGAAKAAKNDRKAA